MEKIIIAEFVVLLIGVLFAWTNFTLELVAWLQKTSCPTGCTVGEVVNPFLTPCFYGALIFTIAFVLSAVLLYIKQ
jgi:hypothetical protein